MVVVVVRYETTATARWALLFIVRAFFNDTITVAVWTGFHVRLMGMSAAPHGDVSAIISAGASLIRLLRHVSVMSALPPKADIGTAIADVCFGPKADSCSAAKASLFDHLIGAQ
jgi:hypothetical protein